MSHFYAIVLLRKECVNDEVDEEIANLMEKYNENRIVEEYDTKCWCVERKQREEKRKRIEKETGMSWSTAREDFDKYFNEKFPVNPKTLTHDQKMEHLAKQQVEWEKFTAPLRNTECKYNTDDFNVTPDAGCNECHGKGTVKSTYNPDSKWDWYVIGGRWDGVTQGKERDDGEGGFNFGPEHHQLQYNYSPVSDLIKRKVIPFALITPDGVWNERGKCGFWGIVKDPKCEDVWDSTVLDIYKNYEKDYVGIGLDCHI